MHSSEASSAICRGSTWSGRSGGPRPLADAPGVPASAALGSRLPGTPSTLPGDAVSVLDVDTPHGPARAFVHAADRATGGLILGHGANGHLTAPDLVAVTEGAVS